MALMEMMMPSYVAAPGAVSFVNVGTLGSSGNAITMGQPATPAVNDIWIMVVQTSNQSITTPTNATAGTWAEIATQAGTGTATVAGATRLGFFWHRWTTTTGNVTVADSGDHQIARIAAYRGCKTGGDPWNAVSVMASVTAGGVTQFQNGITTTVDNCCLLWAMGHSFDVADTAQLSTLNSGGVATPQKRFDNTLATGTGGGIILCDGFVFTAGTLTGTTTPPQGMNAGFANTANIIKCTVALEPA